MIVVSVSSLKALMSAGALLHSAYSFQMLDHGLLCAKGLELALVPKMRVETLAEGLRHVHHVSLSVYLAYATTWLHPTHSTIYHHRTYSPFTLALWIDPARTGSNYLLM